MGVTTNGVTRYSNSWILLMSILTCLQERLTSHSCLLWRMSSRFRAAALLLQDVWSRALSRKEMLSKSLDAARNHSRQLSPESACSTQTWRRELLGTQLGFCAAASNGTRSKEAW